MIIRKVILFKYKHFLIDKLLLQIKRKRAYKTLNYPLKAKKCKLNKMKITKHRLVSNLLKKNEN